MVNETSCYTAYELCLEDFLETNGPCNINRVDDAGVCASYARLFRSGDCCGCNQTIHWFGSEVEKCYTCEVFADGWYPTVPNPPNSTVVTDVSDYGYYVDELITRRLYYQYLTERAVDWNVRCPRKPDLSVEFGYEYNVHEMAMWIATNAFASLVSLT